MATSSSHLKQWKHNRDFVSRIPPEYPDWIVTVTFYASLHLIDSLLIHDKVTRVTSHSSRNDVLMRTNRYRDIFLVYQPLYGLSHTVRYLADPSSWIPAADLEAKVLGGYLYRIEDSISRKLPGFAKPEAITLMSRG